MSLEKRWRFRSAVEAEADALARRLGLTAVTARILLNRGVADEVAARAMLRPELAQLHEPSAHPLFEPAARRIRDAVTRGERIVVYGDYDVDGISATAILMRCLALLKADAAFYIPDRMEEGYGLNAAAIRRLAADGTKLLITVDSGVSAVAEVALAQELGMDVIVTDHHEPGDVVPATPLLINPKLPGCPYPFRDLSGAGVAFKLAWAVGRDMSAGARVAPEFRDYLLDAVSLAALGTIADVVPLMGENRVLASYGLRGLTASNAPGIRALREASSATEQNLTGFDVAFKLAPRLNAAGRMGSATQAVEMLITSSLDRAREIAAHLNRENGRRQRIQESILSDAREMIEELDGVQGRSSLVLAREGWHSGVIGIVAARVAETYWRPTVMLTIDSDGAHGSARSVGGFNLFEALRKCSARLTGFGGHARAAGLRLKREELDRFREEFEAVAEDALRPEDMAPVIDIDCEVRLPAITKPLLDEFAQLAPFGEGNAEPMLAARGVTLAAGVTRMGSSGQHLCFWINQDGAAFRAVAFGKGDWADRLHGRKNCSLAFVPRVNRWQGTERLELDVRDVKVD